MSDISPASHLQDLNWPGQEDVILAGMTTLILILTTCLSSPQGRIGVIADVQFVDQDDGFDFTGVQRRRYRNSLEVLLLLLILLLLLLL